MENKLVKIMADILACTGIATLYSGGVLIMSSIPLLFRKMKQLKNKK